MRSKVIFVTVIVVLCLTGVAGYALRPVCTPIPDADLKNFNIPIEQRTDRDFYLKVFQQREGHWYQCKTAVSRLFFF
jgi:hypothetical protein